MAAKRKKPLSKDNSVRIIGGDWRGRKLNVGNEEGLRPSGDRMRETLFNWLMPYIHGANCLDAFAGTGSLSFEALSRGASSATLIEQNSNSAACLRDNAALLEANAKIFQTDFLSWKPETHTSFDIIFLDPPFAGDLWQSSLQHILNTTPLAAETFVHIEAPRDQNLSLPPQWQIHREKNFGQVKALLCKT